MINFPIEKIIPLCKENGIELDSGAVERLNIYGNMLVQWNEKMNLTAITEPDEVVIKHFYDCLLFFKNVKVEKGASVIDVGTGAGFPGLVLLIARPDIKLTLLDSLNKRLVFLSEVLKEIGLSANIIHARAEEGSRKKELREQFDIACARAVANMNVLSEYCIPYVKIGGSFVALKGALGAEEALNAERAISVLGGSEPTVYFETLTGDEQRTIIVTKKISQTPTKYPRISAKIAKQPL